MDKAHTTIISIVFNFAHFQNLRKLMIVVSNDCLGNSEVKQKENDGELLDKKGFTWFNGHKKIPNKPHSFSHICKLGDCRK